MGSSGSSVAALASSCSQPAEDSAHDFHDKYILGPKLGRGSFAEVYATKQIDDDTPQVSKRMAVKVRPRKSKEAMFLEEELWLAVGHHSNCVRLYEVFHGELLSYMVMERCERSLHHHIKNNLNLTERTLGSILLHMLQSLCHVHSFNVVHRDIKPDNFLIGGTNGQTVKLCDFGLSARLLKGSELLSDIVGTPPFMCPEMLLGKGYDFKADVWSVGVIAYAFLFGTFPYIPKMVGSNSMKRAIARGVSPTFIPEGEHTPSRSQFRSSTTVDFVRSLLSRHPEQRISAIAACNMEYTISIADGNHAPSVELPSLEPTISSACKLGLFCSQDVHKKVEVDILLNYLQMERHQVPLCERRPAPAKTNPRKNSKDIVSDTMSMPSTACPSENPSRTASKTSAESRQSTEMESQAGTPKRKAVLSM